MPIVLTDDPGLLFYQPTDMIVYSNVMIT